MSDTKKKITVGILAHVDAGKTTLSETMLFRTGAVDRLGRVDKKDTHLDTVSVERARGITVFSKQAVFTVGATEVTLVDTPGHIDFSCETERALSIQDYAILVISAAEGVQAHTKTLWQLLSARRVPVILFVNKTDLMAQNRDEVFAAVREQLSPRCVNFSTSDRRSLCEEAAAQDECLMREFFESDDLAESSIADAIAKRGIFPCFFGSALKNAGIGELLEALDRLTVAPVREENFGAKVYKIARDPSGARLTYLKITGGELYTKDVLTLSRPTGETAEEKVEEIRLYSGEKYKTCQAAEAGTLVCIPGLKETFAGMGIGFEPNDETVLAPVMEYTVELPDESDMALAYRKLLPLAEEEPSLDLGYDERSREIRVHLMGGMQAEVLSTLIAERFGLRAVFGEGKILYRETVAEPVMGCGHYEPLRHYAEVRLLLEPLPAGSGMLYCSDCPTDLLPLHYQKQVISALEERVHRGVLTDSPLTDMKVTLLIGKGHIKHTEGGDFAKATSRALRQGLLSGRSILLEPTYDFLLTVPRTSLGRAMTDIDAMFGTVDPPIFPEGKDDIAELHGNCPVSTMRTYAKDVSAYTHGEGRLILSVGDYIPCHNAEEVIAAIGYDPESDLHAKASSVFCENGAGVSVPWYEVPARMHTPDPTKPPEPIEEKEKPVGGAVKSYRSSVAEDRELLALFERTYGKIKPRKVAEKTEYRAAEERRERPKKQKPKGDDFLVVDGYNLMYAWPELTKSVKGDFAHGREMLIHLLANAAAFRKWRVILVFDAYLRKGGTGSVENVAGISVVYTKEAETADSYIEKTTHEIAPNHTVRVVTSDREEQYIILGNGALRVSAKEFIEEMKSTSLEIRGMIESFSLGR